MPNKAVMRQEQTSDAGASQHLLANLNRKVENSFRDKKRRDVWYAAAPSECHILGVFYK